MLADGIVHGVGFCEVVEDPSESDEFRGANILEEALQFVAIRVKLLGKDWIIQE